MENVNVPKTLSGKKLIGFSLGALGIVLPVTLFNTYVFQYYVYTIGLDSIYVSIGIFIGLSIYAIFSPIMGVWSDRVLPNRWGKKRPFLLYGLPTTLLAGILVWMPPKVPRDMLIENSSALYWPTAIFLWAISALLNFSFVILVSPYNAMIPEQCQTEKNRIEVSTLQGLFYILGSIVGILFPMILHSNLEDPKALKWYEESGEYLTHVLPWVGFLFGLILIVCMIIAFLSADEKEFIEEYKKRQEQKELSQNPQSFNFSEALRGILSPLKNKNMQYFLLQTVSLNMGLRILIIVLVPILTFVLEIEGIQFIYFSFSLMPFAIGGFLYWQNQAKKKGTIPSFARSMEIISLSLLLSLVMLIPMSFLMRLLVGFLLFAIDISCMVGGYLFPNPILGDIVDEYADEILKKRNMEKSKAISEISGSYYGLNLSVINLASAFAAIILGIIFTGNNSNNPLYIVLSLPTAAIFYWLARVFILKVKTRRKNS